MPPISKESYLLGYRPLDPVTASPSTNAAGSRNVAVTLVNIGIAGNPVVTPIDAGTSLEYRRFSRIN